MKAPTSTDKLIGERLRQRRHELKVSQKTLAEHLGITFQQIQKYEQGTDRLASSRLQSIAQFLGVALSYFFTPPGEDAHLSTAVGAGLMEPGAIELFAAYGRIESEKDRRAIINMARKLARLDAESGDDTGVPLVRANAERAAALRIA